LIFFTIDPSVVEYVLWQLPLKVESAPLGSTGKKEYCRQSTFLDVRNWKCWKLCIAFYVATTFGKVEKIRDSMGKLLALALFVLLPTSSLYFHTFPPLFGNPNLSRFFVRQSDFSD